MKCLKKVGIWVFALEQVCFEVCSEFAVPKNIQAVKIIVERGFNMVSPGLQHFHIGSILKLSKYTLQAEVRAKETLPAEQMPRLLGSKNLDAEV